MQFAKNEEKILRFWKKHKIFEKSVKKNAGGKRFVFYEGPPTANGRPGMHHVEARAFKDIIPRYKTMRGFWVERKGGWDTHGLPVELQVEKELGFKNKEDIEKYGIAKFNKKCKESVWHYKDEWERMTERIGYWIDTKDPYITYENKYIESVWQIIKKIWQKGLLYKGFKVVPHCTRCGTGLSSHEVSQGYKSVKDNSVYLNFKITKGNKKAQKGNIVLAWTTTPWTLPGNVALAVGAEITYVKISYQKEKYILAKDRLAVIGGEYKILDEFKGCDLVGAEYQPLFTIKPIAQSGKKAYYIVAADFVSTDDGTGVVHTAVMYGEDDYSLGKKIGLPEVHTVDLKGYFTDSLKLYGLAGKYVKSADTEKIILEYLKKNHLLFKEEICEHDYPFCWRCDTPLLYYAKNSWFISMAPLRKFLVKNNKRINWEPKHIRDGRFGEFVKEARDWALSRERYWGTPLPVWICRKCGKEKAIGSMKELGVKIADLHRPGIDKVVLKCSCGGKMTREKDVIDVWLDSGAMPFAQWGYPWQKGSKEKLKKHYPADYICEAVDQTRGWFYTLLAIATLMEYAGEIKDGICFKNVICLGHVLDKDGKKMSKSRGNVVDPWQMCEQFGADTLRWYLYTVNQAGEPKKFDVKDVADKNRRVFGTLLNSFVFWQTYRDKTFKPKKSKPAHILDKWIVSRFNSTCLSVVESLEKYDVVSAARQIEELIDDFSNWYIRRSRTRFQKPENKKQKEQAQQSFYQFLFSLTKLIAPFAPFISEDIYQSLRVKKDPASVHLCAYPKPDKKLVDRKLEDQMAQARIIAALALAERAKHGIKVRQPLKELKIKNGELSKDLQDLICDEVNVKEIIRDSGMKEEIELDTEITEDLKLEGMVREITRHIQEMRRDAGLKPTDRIYLRYRGEDMIKNLIGAREKEIMAETGVRKMELAGAKKEAFLAEKIVKLDGHELWLAIKK